MKNTNQQNAFEESFLEDNMDAIAAMTAVMAEQQKTALDLTKLILEHCKIENLTKEDVFEIYEEASDFLKGQLENFEE